MSTPARGSARAPLALPVRGTGESYPVRPSKIIALGLNYHSHIAESHSVKVQGFTNEVPEEPILFPKTPNVLVGPGEPIVLPAWTERYHFEEPRIDYEAELAFIVGERCRNVPAGQAERYIFGYTCFNDVSFRNIQTADRSGWFRGKSLDTFGPIGPEIVPTRAIPDPQKLAIRCRLNGRLVQDSNTSQMIFPVREILAFVSMCFTLEAGDIVATGTPAGVGPLAAGDRVEVEVEGIGILSNPVVAERVDDARGR
ncbi:MAG: fumarylacetoacetate hydrolase family protein [Spirochaetales bacterium]|nr:fumarylacetoacetate hydrolase family protein [Spirochaetales bacterium]